MRLRLVRLLGRWLRVVVLLFAVAGLTPLAQAGDALEAALGSHHAEVVADNGCGTDCRDDCEKSGCHAGVHHCGCCAPAPRIASQAPFLLALWHEVPLWQTDRSRAPPTLGQAPPRQPPRA